MNEIPLVVEQFRGLYSYRNSSRFSTLASITPGVLGVVHVTDIALGTEVNQRIGRKITLTKLETRVWVYNNNTTTSNFDVIRCSLVFDAQPTGSLPTITDIYATNRVSSLQNASTFTRFQILREWFFVMGTYASAIAAPEIPTAIMTESIDLPNFSTIYGSTNFPTTGALYFCYSDCTSGTTIDMENRIFWDDK